MAKREIRTSKAAAPAGAYSQGIIANGFLYTAGVGPLDPETGEKIGTTIAEQTTVTLANLQAILAEAGLDFSDVVKTTVHLQDSPRDFAGFNEVYESHFQKPYPVRTTVGSTLAGILVEIDLVAALRQ
jgi:2-iminobutanoate/2-iminopropanoate deaminase